MFLNYLHVLRRCGALLVPPKAEAPSSRRRPESKREPPFWNPEGHSGRPDAEERKEPGPGPEYLGRPEVTRWGGGAPTRRVFRAPGHGSDVSRRNAGTCGSWPVLQEVRRSGIVSVFAW